MYIHVYISMHVYIYICIYTYACTYAHIHVFAYVGIHAYICIHICKHICIHIYIYVYICMYTHTQAVVLLHAWLFVDVRFQDLRPGPHYSPVLNVTMAAAKKLQGDIEALNKKARGYFKDLCMITTVMIPYSSRSYSVQ